MSVFIQDKTWLNFTPNFFDQTNPKSKIRQVQEREVDLYQRFCSHSKNKQECNIRSKNSWFRLEVLSPIIHSCSFFKQYEKHQIIIYVH